MSLRSLLLLAGAAAASSSSSSASTSTSPTSTFFQAPTTVTAGVQATATIASGTFRSTANNGDTSAMRALEVFLALGGRDVYSLSANTTSECYLSQDTPICDFSGITVHSDHIEFADALIPFTVPSSVGGAALLYGLRIQILQADGTVYGASSLIPQSNEFHLANATGRSQLFSTVYAPAAYIPCESLSCVNSCFADLFGVSANLTSESASTAECANKCAGISDSESIPSDWLEVASSASAASTAAQVLTTVPAGTATGCFVSGTGTGAAATGTGTSTNGGQGLQNMLPGSWILVAAGMLAVL